MSRPTSFVELVIEQHGSVDAAVAALQEDLNLRPVEARLDLQVLYNAVGREDEAFVISNELMGFHPRDPRALFNRGWHLLRRGDFETGFACLEFGRGLNVFGSGDIGSIKPLWTKDSARPRQFVLLSSEGGLGDQIINFRFARDLCERYGARVIVSCDPGLATVFGRSPWVSAVVQSEARLGVYHDAWIPAMSAPRLLGITYDTLASGPYLAADPSRLSAWRGVCRDNGDKRLKVGIRWSGNPKFEHQQLRKFPSQLLTDLHAVEGVHLFSFQRDHDLVHFAPEGAVTDLGPFLRDWEDTAAALCQMDLVISSCTSVAHMSAALGVPTWVVLPVLPYYVWSLPGEKSPWYDSVRLFRQTEFGEWGDVADQLRAALSARVEVTPQRPTYA